MSWEVIFPILGVTAVLLAGFLIARFLFQNFFTSRILCLACCGAAIHQAITVGTADVLTCCILCILGWLFYRGENNFDFEYTGWVTYYTDGTSEEESVGGFFSHAVATTIAMGLIFGVLVPLWNFLMFLIPGGIIAMDVLSFGIFFLDQ